MERSKETRLPFAKSHTRRGIARIEFDVFQAKAAEAIHAATQEVAGFDELKQYCHFYVVIRNRDTVEAFFGKRPVPGRDTEGKPAYEAGAHLLYTLASTGDVLVTLYPCKSSFHNVYEDHIYIGLGRYTAHQLLSRARTDVRALVAYGYVSSLEAESTLGERLRIGWLRFIRPSQSDGKYEAGGSTVIVSSLKAMYKTALIGAFTSVMRPIGYVVVALALAHYGHEAWIDFFRAK